MLHVPLYTCVYVDLVLGLVIQLAKQLQQCCIIYMHHWGRITSNSVMCVHELEPNVLCCTSCQIIKSVSISVKDAALIPLVSLLIGNHIFMHSLTGYY